MGTDIKEFNMSMPAHPMHYDTDFNYKKDRAFWLRLILCMMGATYAKNRWDMEVGRHRMTQRMEGYKDLPGHHLNNRGGVVVLKNFAGFEKYY